VSVELRRRGGDTAVDAVDRWNGCSVLVKKAATGGIVGQVGGGRELGGRRRLGFLGIGQGGNGVVGEGTEVWVCVWVEGNFVGKGSIELLVRARVLQNAGGRLCGRLR